MRLFFYYALHTFKNQLKKLFKTWVLIVLLCCLVLGGLFGGLIGLSASLAHRRAPEASEPAPAQSAASEPAAQSTEPAEPEIITEYEFEQTDDLHETADIVEAAAGLLCLIMFFVMLLGADKNGSRIFLPADVNLLFSAPLKPQSVLMFRLLTQMGAMLAASIYLVFQLPNLILNLGLGAWAAVTLLLVWVFMMITGKLLQLFAYVVCASRPAFKRRLRPVLYAGILLLAFWLWLYVRQSGKEFFPAAISFLSGSAARYVPFWGWLKAICRCAVLGDWTGVLCWFAALLLGGGLLTWLIWRIKADFYEDAMAQSEETAELLAKVQADRSGNTALRRRKKDRPDRLLRDGLTRGSGARMFFFKAMYNRRRFAHFGLLTKTSETYAVTALALAILCRFAWEISGVIPVALTLSGFAFFRAMGNALSQDVQQDHFLLIPEQTLNKLFWSLLGVLANCALDLLIAMLLVSPVLGENPLRLLAWLPFAVSLNFFCTAVGSFINFSVPVSAGKTVKQVVQVMFVYFGLFPSIGMLLLCYAARMLLLGALAGTLLNTALGLLFFLLLPRFVSPGERS